MISEIYLISLKIARDLFFLFVFEFWSSMRLYFHMYHSTFYIPQFLNNLHTKQMLNFHSLLAFRKLIQRILTSLHNNSISITYQCTWTTFPITSISTIPIIKIILNLSNKFILLYNKINLISDLTYISSRLFNISNLFRSNISTFFIIIFYTIILFIYCILLRTYLFLYL